MIRLIAITFLSLFCLSSCMNAALTGAEAVYKRDYLSTKADDEWVRLRVYRTIYHEHAAEFKNTHIVFAAYDHRLLLAGQAPDAKQKALSESIAKQLFPERTLHNFIEITEPTSSMVRMSDHWITTKIMSRFMSEKNFAGHKFNVLTENGTVFLMGSVTVEEADQAVLITQQVDGIKRIIKMMTLYQRVH